MLALITTSVYGRNLREFVNVNVIYNECYASVTVEEIDNVSVLNDMIDLKEGLGVLCYFKHRICKIL